jgi:uncharacterized protein with PQ loop repeat
MHLAELAAILATVLGCVGVVPQCLRLAHSGDTRGVSLAGTSLGLITEAAWVMFLVEQHLWSAVALPVLMVVANAALVCCTLRAGASPGAAVLANAAWTLALLAVTGFGGWAALGLVLGGSYAVQMAPTISAAYRSDSPSGVAPARWVIVLCEAMLWTCYGFVRDVPSLVLFGVVAACSSVAILVRCTATAHSAGVASLSFATSSQSSVRDQVSSMR